MSWSHLAIMPAGAPPGQVWGPVWTQHAVRMLKPDRTAVVSCAGDEARAAGPRAVGASGKLVGGEGAAPCYLSPLAASLRL